MYDNSYMTAPCVFAILSFYGLLLMDHSCFVQLKIELFAAVRVMNISRGLLTFATARAGAMQYAFLLRFRIASGVEMAMQAQNTLC